MNAPAGGASRDRRAGREPGRSLRVAVLEGDGIGPEVTAQAVAVLEAVLGMAGAHVDFARAPVGGAALDLTGLPLPAETLDVCLSADAVLLGAVGGPRWEGLPPGRVPEAGLLGLRKAMGLYANVRPVTCYPAIAGSSPLRPERVSGADLVIFRELGGGLYYGLPRYTEDLPGGGERAVDTLVYTTDEIRRLARLAFETALRRRRQVVSVDKANVLDSSRLWRRTVRELASDYPGLTVEHAYVDSFAMALVSRPTRFDVIVTGNMFGDILSDLAACIAGSLGMLASASLGSAGGLYEPVHGSAPDIAGRDAANPLGAILSAAMMCDLSLELPKAAAAVRGAVGLALEAGYRTCDIASGAGGERVVGTRSMGQAVLRCLAEAWKCGPNSAKEAG